MLAGAAALAAWWALYLSLSPFSRWFTYSLLSLAPETRLGAAIAPEVSEIATPADTSDRVSWLRAVMAGTWTEAGPDYVGWRANMGAFVSALPAGTAVFSHFVAINALCGLLEGDDRVTVFRPGHCSVTRLDMKDGRLRVAEYGSESATRVL